MAFYDTLAWNLIQSTLAFVVVVRLGATHLRLRAVKGSERRFQAATVERLTMFPAFLFWVLTMVEARADGEHYMVVPSGLMLLLSGYDIYRFYRDNDDDWFTGAGRRMRRWARAKFGSLGTQPHPSGA